MSKQHTWMVKEQPLLVAHL